MNRFCTFILAATMSTSLALTPGLFAQTLPPPVAEKVQAAQKQIKMIGPDDYRKIVSNLGETLIVDVREPQEFAAGHVPGAINIPRGVLEFKIWNHVGYPTGTRMDQPIVLQCQSGNRASLAAQALTELGFTKTSAVVMSLDEWQKAGHPFEK